MLAPLTGGKSVAHRFWIDASEIPYIESQHQKCVHYKFGAVEMKLKTQILTRNAKGDIVDANTPISSDDDVAPVGLFAESFSKNYDRISSSFPVFARLRQLYMLMAAFSMANGHVMGREADSRMTSAWYGANQNRKIKAVDKAVEFATAA